MTGTSHEDPITRMIISRCILFKMRNVSEFVYIIKTHILYSKTCSFENRAVYEIMWKNTLQPDRLQITIRHMRSACWITNATDVQLENIIFIAFPRKKWLRERA
jgi:hypothetical protein